MTERSNHVLPADPVVEAYKKDLDRTLLRETRKLTLQERLERLQDQARLAAELRRAGSAARRSS